MGPRSAALRVTGIFRGGALFTVGIMKEDSGLVCVGSCDNLGRDEGGGDPLGLSVGNSMPLYLERLRFPVCFSPRRESFELLCGRADVGVDA